MFTNRSGTIRLYDGTATPQYLSLKFDSGDFGGPLGPALREEILVMDRGKLSADMFYRLGPAEKIMEAIQIPFSALITHLAVSGYLVDWIYAMNDGAVTTVDGNTIVTTKGTSQRGGIDTPQFADSNKIASDLEIFWDEPGIDFGLRFQEVWVGRDQAQVKESGDNVLLNLAMACYGNISKITSFTAGTDITAGS